MRSDEVYILDVNGYVGESTANEEEWALLLGKRVRYLSKEFPEWDKLEKDLPKFIGMERNVTKR